MNDDLLLGIDGGGTKTVAWIARADDAQSVVGRGAAGPSNPQVVGADACVARMEEAIDSAFADAGLKRQLFAAACIGLAGADRDRDRATIQEWASRIGLAGRLSVVNDALPVLYAANPAGCGIALISGTGSFAFGRREDGTTARAGGWGYLFGDEGSAYAIAVDALRAAAKAADGRGPAPDGCAGPHASSGPATSLLDMLLAELGITRAEELISAVYAPAMTRDRVAALSRVVFEADQSGDGVAGGIIDNAAGALAEMVAAVALRLRVDAHAFPLALAGGVLLHRQELRDRLQSAIHHRGLHVGTVVAVDEPVAGALVVAQQAASSKHPDSLPAAFTTRME